MKNITLYNLTSIENYLCRIGDLSSTTKHLLDRAGSFLGRKISPDAERTIARYVFYSIPIPAAVSLLLNTHHLLGAAVSSSEVFLAGGLIYHVERRERAQDEKIEQKSITAGMKSLFD
jgi:hypothetical protein